MKNKLAIYLSALVMSFVALSCSWDDDSDVASPYAYVKSFAIGDIKSSYPSFTSSGKDTTVVKTIAGSSWSFTINQSSCEIFNPDSLPFSTNVSKVTVKMNIQGVASLYDEQKEKFEYMSTSDSIDFTRPRTIRITSLDDSYFKDYTVSVNVHKVDPEKMVWNKVDTPTGIVLEKAVEFNGEMLALGKLKATGNPSILSMPLDGKTWAPLEVEGLPTSSVDFTTATVFNGALYALAEGSLYKSADAITWSRASQGDNLVAIVGASDTVCWVANKDKIFRTVDGVTLTEFCELPEGFPLYGISAMSYPMSHNKNIIRYMLVGYSTPEKDDKPRVWSILSTEEHWTEYDNSGNPYLCPALDNLAVLRYGGLLYAFGGNGIVGGKEVKAFSSFYISRDNGIVWKAYEGFYQLLPVSLLGKDVPFVATVDSNNFMWIITDDASAGVWRGIINRLGFKK